MHDCLRNTVEQGAVRRLAAFQTVRVAVAGADQPPRAGYAKGDRIVGGRNFRSPSRPREIVSSQ